LLAGAGWRSSCCAWPAPRSLTLLTRNSAPVAAPAEQLSLVVQRMPFEAQNALRGESSAFDALAKSAARLKTLRGAHAGHRRCGSTPIGAS
jgi:hypothetical protein